MENNPSIPCITLIGDPLESFYQLGLKDKTAFPEIIAHIKHFFKMGIPAVDVLVEGTAQALGQRIVSGHSTFHQQLMAYSEGLEADIKDIILGVMFPDLLSAISKWLPQFPTSLLGCSSAFALNSETHNLMHTRVLDFPLLRTYEGHERAIYYKFKQQQKVFSLSTAGVPTPSITGMNESGITLALHQKFNKEFYIKGTPIFEIAQQILFNARDKKDILEYLNSTKTMTTWGLKIGLPNQQCMLIDMTGDDIQIKTEEISEHNVTYFNNLPVNPDEKFQRSSFYGFHHYCESRSRAFQEKLKQQKATKLSAHSMFKLMAAPHIQAKKNFSQLECDTMTINSVAVVNMEPLSGRCQIISGLAPKVYRNCYQEFTHIWEQDTPISLSVTKGKIKAVDNYQQGLNHLALSALAFDQKNAHEAFHHIQLTIEYWHNLPHQIFASFYFLVYQYIFAKQNNELLPLKTKFVELVPALKPYFKDLAQLFIARIEQICELPPTITAADIQDPFLKQIFIKEQKLKPIILKLLRKTILPKPDIWDVLHIVQ